MKLKTIVFPCDFSSKGNEALEYATTLARESGARLLIVHVQEPPIAYAEGAFYYGIPDPDPDALRGMLQQVKPHDASVTCEHRFVQGDPASQIVELATKEQADLIVMSSHGRTGLGRLIMGSVAESVLRQAACPVLVVKPNTQVASAEAVGSKG